MSNQCSALIAASAAFHFAERGIAVIGPVPGGLPSIGLPDVNWSETMALLPVAASCFVMIITQSAATSHVFSVRYHERVDEDADILGLSAANAAAAVSGTFVVNGSPTQTAMADRAGARSQIAQLVFSGVALLVLLLLTGPLQYLPRCVLGAIVFIVAIRLVNVRGQILSVIDIKKFFDLPEKGLSDLNKIIIIHAHHMELGILADAILGVRSLALEELQPALPTLTGIRAEYLKGITKQPLVVLDVEKILSDEKILVNDGVSAAT